MGIIIHLNKKQNAPQRKPFEVFTPFDTRNGFFGVVKEVHSENNTVHVVTDTGRELMNIPVASQQWVTYKKDGKPQLTGERNLPPVGTYVYCVMPNGTYDDCFVLCSMFSTASIHKDYMADDEDTANTRLCQENGGWLKTTDIRTGTKVIKNKPENETIKIEIDQESEGEEKATITIHGNVVTVSKDGIEIKTDGKVSFTADKDLELNVSGNATIKCDKDASIEAQNVTVKSSVKTEIKGGQVKLAGTVTPTGSGALCGLPSCLFTGAPHVGDTSLNA